MDLKTLRKHLKKVFRASEFINQPDIRQANKDSCETISKLKKQVENKKNHAL